MAAAQVTIDDNGVRAALVTLGRGLEHLDEPLRETGEELVEEIAPLVPVDTGRAVDDLRAELDGREGVVVSIGRSPRVAEYVRIINASHGRFMDTGEDRAGDVAVDRLTDYIDQLIDRTGLDRPY